jgi:eukaryotic-like serine/threonine-protein kinase
MLAPNTLLQGRYRIIRLISQGNMGAVYLAEHIQLDNEVALKETFFAGGDADAREQFHREARLLSRLRHSALPRVTDHFIEGNGQFLVMDYIAGEDLQELLQANGGPFSVAKVLGWAEQLLDVLNYLHTQNEPVIHRDIKPANIKLTPRGEVILLDFGLAKGSSASLQMSFRAATPAYAPLEQLTGQGTDARSDLYSLAVTLYHLMTAQLPPTSLERIAAVGRGRPDPLISANDLNPRVPAGIAGVLTRAMSLEPDNRPTSVLEMREALFRDEAPTTPIKSPVPPPPVVLSPDEPQTTPAKLGPALQTFEFDVVTLDSKGQIKERRKGQARCFTENIGGVAIEMVEIPGGAFLMGSPDSEANRFSNEGPQHQVTVLSFFVGKYAVTQKQWRAVSRLPKIELDLNGDPSHFKGDNLPVEAASWKEVMEFCNRLSKATGKTYRLPTEAEWEYACRAGTTTPFAFGETITPETVNYNGNYPYGLASKGRYRKQTVPVGSLGVANGFGLYDMHGNVWEWCLDTWHENYNGAPGDGNVWEGGDTQKRVLRGGSWRYFGSLSRAANRDGYAPDLRDYNVGFRVVAVARTR